MVILSSDARMRAMPKSASFTARRPPSSETMMFSGFRSRWMTPAAWAWTSASASARPMSAPTSGDPMPTSSAKARSVRPWMNSVTSQLSSLPSPEQSKISTMLGCERRATARASREKRARDSARAARWG